MEINPMKVWLLNYFIIAEKLTENVSIRCGNIFNFGASQADDIYFYLTHQIVRLFILQKFKAVVLFAEAA